MKLTSIILTFSLVAGFLLPATAQKEINFDVKIKTGFTIHSLPGNDFTAIGSSKEVLLVNNGGGVISRTFSGSNTNIIDVHSDSRGDLLAASNTSGECLIWDLTTDKLKYTLIGDSKALIAGRFADQELLATIGRENILKIWDLNNGTVRYSYADHKKNVLSLAAGSNLVLTGDNEGLVVLRSTSQDSLLYQWQFNAGITNIEIGGRGKRVFIGTDQGELITASLENFSIIARMDNGRGQINKLAIAADNRHLAVASRDIKVYDTETNQLVKEIDQVASAVIAVSFTPDGENLFYIEEFAPRAYCYDVSDLDIAFGMNFQDKNDKLPPQIYLSSPAKIVDNRVVSYENLLALRGSVIDDYGVQELKINGITTPVRENGNFVINIPLSMGDNFITIEVTDINQNTAVKKFIAARKNMDGTDYDPSEATNYLLVIGINKYEHWPQLYNAVKDANDVVGTLLGMYDFEFANVTLLTNEQATRSNLYNTLRGFVNKVGPKDNFMIYYSGHGYFDELLNEGYWVPSDARLNQTGDFLSNSDISKIIANIDSQHTFLVADACFSGSLFNESSRGYAENVEKFRSRWGLASGRLETVSDGEIGANSPFAQSFIGYLKTNDKEKIAISQLVQYVKVEVAEISNQTPIGNPLKGVGDEGGEFVLYKK